MCFASPRFILLSDRSIRHHLSISSPSGGWAPSCQAGQSVFNEYWADYLLRAWSLCLAILFLSLNLDILYLLISLTADRATGSWKQRWVMLHFLSNLAEKVHRLIYWINQSCGLYHATIINVNLLLIKQLAIQSCYLAYIGNNIDLKKLIQFPTRPRELLRHWEISVLRTIKENLICEESKGKI